MIAGTLESAGYLDMTEEVLSASGLRFTRDRNAYTVFGKQRAALPEQLASEGDWSNAAFFLCAGALSDDGIRVSGLSTDSSQGDRAVLDLLRKFGAQVSVNGEEISVCRGNLRGIRINAAPIPDLIPVISVIAAVAEGETQIVNAARLRLKESDRLYATSSLLRDLGADVEEKADGLVIHGKKPLNGGVVSAFGDHRIAMSAAVAACAAKDCVVIDGAESVEKSYPRFWDDFRRLTGGAI